MAWKLYPSTRELTPEGFYKTWRKETGRQRMSTQKTIKCSISARKEMLRETLSQLTILVEIITTDAVFNTQIHDLRAADVPRWRYRASPSVFRCNPSERRATKDANNFTLSSVVRWEPQCGMRPLNNNKLDISYSNNRQRKNLA